MEDSRDLEGKLSEANPVNASQQKEELLDEMLSRHRYCIYYFSSLLIYRNALELLSSFCLVG